jgi:hypothetical protein
VRDLTSADEKHTRYELELVEQKLRYKGLIESADARRAQLMHMVRTRKERRPVRVEDLLRKDGESVYVVATVRLDTGEEVRCRTAHPDELQKHLPGLEAAEELEARIAKGPVIADIVLPSPPRRGRPPKKAPEPAPQMPETTSPTAGDPVPPVRTVSAETPAAALPDDEFDRIATEDPENADFFGSTE